MAQPASTAAARPRIRTRYERRTARVELLGAQRDQERMGSAIWWPSLFRNDFNVDVGVSFREQGLGAGYAEYNCRALSVPADQLPNGGKSSEPVDDAAAHEISALAFVDRAAYHRYGTYARGGDVLWSMYGCLDRAPLGRNEDGMWRSRHDEYEAHRTPRWRTPISPRRGAP
jgi:predicted dithiol-disulfide oxidoreductase (DUF899 family)